MIEKSEGTAMNLVLLLAIISWAVAQILKVIVVLIAKRKLDIQYIVSGGGMPSSHSAMVCACATATGVLVGVESVAFAITAVLAFIVMYDAFNVRKETGEQAKVLNYMMEHWNEMKPEMFGKELKELIGHTPLQVFAGAVLGSFIGLLGCWIAS